MYGQLSTKRIVAAAAYRQDKAFRGMNAALPDIP
jgi:hypothetical protein